MYYTAVLIDHLMNTVLALFFPMHVTSICTAMDGLQVMTPSKMLKTFMGTEELQSTYSDSHSETGVDNETISTFCGQRESVSSSSRGSMGSLSSIISDDLSGNN